jgi:hypothetical protein
MLLPWSKLNSVVAVPVLNHRIGHFNMGENKAMDAI